MTRQKMRPASRAVLWIVTLIVLAGWVWLWVTTGNDIVATGLFGVLWTIFVLVVVGILASLGPTATAVGVNVARFVNHSCTSNCYAQIVDGVIWIRAAKTIEAGDELTYNYQTEGEKSIQCRCRPGCRTRL